MNFYLVDYENVGIDGITGLNSFQEGDALIIFYSETCKNITIDIMEEVTRMRMVFKSFKVKTGTKNALDFQLSSYIGYLIGKQHEDAQFFIISNDKGYDCLCDFWKDQNVSVKRISTRGGADAKQLPEVRKQSDAKQLPAVKHANETRTSRGGRSYSRHQRGPRSKQRNGREIDAQAEKEKSLQPEDVTAKETSMQAEHAIEKETSVQAERAIEKETSMQAEHAIEKETSVQAENTIGKEASAQPENAVGKDIPVQAENTTVKEFTVQAENGIGKETFEQSESENQPAKRRRGRPAKRKIADGDLATIGEIRMYLSDEDMPEEVLLIFNQYKTKQAICNGITKKCKDSKMAGTIYKKLKPLLKEKKKS